MQCSQKDMHWVYLHSTDFLNKIHLILLTATVFNLCQPFPKLLVITLVHSHHNND